jgi:hypothetical protein
VERLAAHEHAHPARARDDLLQDLQALAGELRQERAEPGHVPARPGETGDVAALDGVGGHRHDDRDRRGRSTDRLDRRVAGRHDHVDLRRHELGGQGRQAVLGALGGPELDHQVAVDVPPEFA